MCTIKDLIKAGLLSEKRPYRSSFENYSSPRVKHGFFEIELNTPRSAYLYAKFHGHAFPCRNYRVSLSTSLESIVSELQQL